MGTAADEGGMEQVKHTLQLPVKLWTAFEDRVGKIGISKSEGVRKAIWLYTFVADEEVSEMVIHRSNGKEERLVISPY